MSDATVQAALRSESPLVVVEAPAGCGKTHQAADYAREIARSADGKRLLILTHTHAACSMIADRTKGAGRAVEIRTIDSLIAQLASAYHAGLALPGDIAAWVRQQGENGYVSLAMKVSSLLRRHPMIAASLVQRYPVVICDEHQDSSGDQHAVVAALLRSGARVRIFADPMQQVFAGKGSARRSAWKWDDLVRQAHAFEQLDFPHRWEDGCPHLGQWTLAARETLKRGGQIDLRAALPPSITVIFVKNEAAKRFDFQVARDSRRPIDQFEQRESSLLILAHHNGTARSFRGFFNRRIPLWEGHTRHGLETLVDAVNASRGHPGALAPAVVAFIGEVAKGFSPSAFGNTFEQEVQEGCVANRFGRPATIQHLARLLVTEPDHRGVAKVLRRLAELQSSDQAFASVAIDHHREFWDAIRIGEFDTPESGLAEITHRRTYSRPKPPDKAISTVHKAKGLECDSVIVMPCDATAFPDNFAMRCLFYVAISRAKRRLMLVVSVDNPSPLLAV